nr:hypothetical protein [Tanacetum cinerariifolium]
MATTIDQQTALDESLIPSTQRLRIGRSNFQLPSDIQSKESTLQVVYDILRNSPIFRAFQLDTKKSILDLEAFREMLHISPRIPNQSFAELPTEEEILEFLRYLGHSHEIRSLPSPDETELIGITLGMMYCSQQSRWNSKAYNEYYASATGEAAPKQKASARKKKGDSASSTTPPTPTPTTTVVSAPRLSAIAKVRESEGESEDEETRQEEEESFDLIPRTPEESEEESNDEEDQDLRLSEEARIQEEEDTDELYRGININQGRGLQYRQTNPFADAVSAIPGRTLRWIRPGSKRQKEGGEQPSASTPSKKATESAGRSTKGDLARQTDARSSFNELIDTPIDFSNFIMNRLNVDTLTPNLLAGPTYELMSGSCTSLTELEYHLEEVYKATTDQLDWVNPEGQQYPHNLLQPLPLIPDNRGRRVSPFEHFINNDLEYLRGDVYSKRRIIAVPEL